MAYASLKTYTFCNIEKGTPVGPWTRGSFYLINFP